MKQRPKGTRARARTHSDAPRAAKPKRTGSAGDAARPADRRGADRSKRVPGRASGDASGEKKRVPGRASGEKKSAGSARNVARPGGRRGADRKNQPGSALEARGSARAQKSPARPTDRRSDAKKKPIAGAKALEPAPDKRTAYPKKPVAMSSLRGDPHPGLWLFTTRTGSEQDLIDELMMAKVVDPAPRKLATALVLSPKLPKREGRGIELTFARQGFEIQQVVASHDLDEVVSRIARTFKGQLAAAEQYALQVWVPDSPEGNPLSTLADELGERLETALAQSAPKLTRVDDATLRRNAGVKLAQVCVVDTAHFLAGVMHGNRTPSLAKGGRTRVRLTGDLPSRAARKIEEALSWLGVAPGPGELCVDLGAAPGGWTYVLAERRARVIAVDPAKLRPDILARKNVRHVQESAFTFAPDEPVDWLFCDMAWRPLEVAALLAKWGRKHWARILVANIKLPMIRKAELLARVRAILESEGDWRHVRAKQLYHDRDEITLSAVRA
jgi:23S rRNA (cytidine2498-2'-O)-methyltransferase